MEESRRKTSRGKCLRIMDIPSIKIWLHQLERKSVGFRRVRVSRAVFQLLLADSFLWLASQLAAAHAYILLVAQPARHELISLINLINLISSRLRFFNDIKIRFVNFADTFSARVYCDVRPAVFRRLSESTRLQIVSPTSNDA